MARITPSVMTKRVLDSWGYHSFHAETYTRRTNKQGQVIHVKRDFGGFADKIAWRPPDEIIAIQVCGYTGYAEHLRKIQESQKAIDWILSGGTIEIWAWKDSSKVGARVKQVVLDYVEGSIVERTTHNFLGSQAIHEATACQRERDQP